MAIFGYKAMTPDGRLVRGELEAINLVDLEMRLRRMELDFVNGQPIRHRALFRPTPAPRRELINFCFHLEQLTRAGVPILEGLADLRDSTEHSRFREVVAGVVEGIEGGRSLSQALEDYPQAFDAVFCNLVRAGETSGNLPHVLHELASALKREDELAAYARKLTIYPAIVGTIILAAISVSLVYGFPNSRAFSEHRAGAATADPDAGRPFRLPAQLLVAAIRWHREHRDRAAPLPLRACRPPGCATMRCCCTCLFWAASAARSCWHDSPTCSP